MYFLENFDDFKFGWKWRVWINGFMKFAIFPNSLFIFTFIGDEF